ncbi:TPM domain-containing protein [Rhizohabitans arisaemae]|uniref:TPM domain-containing protein n=1 Tax=Rhizohabitans arisaemae TaxID=2720610 RepID=UPI0024B1F196|nr:TPM domain-containing protein [Rhizohabitans arisaemae]
MPILTSPQADDVRTAIRHAALRADLRVAVFMGSAQGRARDYAERLHAALGDEQAPRAVLVFVDPGTHALEIVTGALIRGRVTDGQCRLAAMAMVTAFSAGDYDGGLVQGIEMLTEYATHS